MKRSIRLKYTLIITAVMAAVLGVVMLFMRFGFEGYASRQKQKEIRNFQNALTEGTKVVTGGGVYGTVKRIDIEKNRVEVEIARGVVIEVDRAYVFADASALSNAPTSKDGK